MENRGKKKKIKKTRAEEVIGFIETNCRIPEGKLVGQKIKLRDWQKTIIMQIYDNNPSTRRAIITVGRKNAKTTLAAFLLLAHLAGPEHKLNSQLYSTAQSREQAGVVFELAAKIVRMSPQLVNHIVIRDTAKQLLCPELGTKYKALSAEVSTSYGLSPIFIIHDELGQVRGPKSELYDALETATGAQENPLSIIISTQAPTENDLLSILIDDAEKANDPRTVLVMYTADEKLDPFLEKTIRQANPAFGDFLNAKEVMAMAEDARRMPARESNYRNLVLNQRVEATNPFINKTQWRACGAPTVEHFAATTKIYAGLDLSATTDLTALVLIGYEKGQWQVKPTFWLPQDGLAERSRLDRVQYDVWYKMGHLRVSPGHSIEYDFVAHYIKEVVEHNNVQKIAFDRWNFRHLRSSLVRAGIPEVKLEQLFVEFGQGFQSMSPALRALESLILSGKMIHGDHPVMNMCAENSVVTQDPAGNRKLDKAKSRGRIDGMVALAMACAVAEISEDSKPVNYKILVI